MPLKHPDFNIFGEPYPDHIYDVENRYIKIAADKQTVSVEVFLKLYTDSTKTYEIEREKAIYFTLVGLPNDDKQLLKSLYETELLSQHPDEIVDGTPLKNFQII
jgi:hypothetical protein